VKALLLPIVLGTPESYFDTLTVNRSWSQETVPSVFRRNEQRLVKYVMFLGQLMITVGCEMSAT